MSHSWVCCVWYIGFHAVHHPVLVFQACRKIYATIYAIFFFFFFF